MSSASGTSPRHWTRLGSFVPRPPNLPTPGNNPVGAHGQTVKQQDWLVDPRDECNLETAGRARHK